MGWFITRVLLIGPWGNYLKCIHAMVSDVLIQFLKITLRRWCGSPALNIVLQFRGCSRIDYRILIKY